MNDQVEMILLVAAGVVVAGLGMYYGKDLPIIGQARNGFDV